MFYRYSKQQQDRTPSKMQRRRKVFFENQKKKKKTNRSKKNSQGSEISDSQSQSKNKNRNSNTPRHKNDKQSQKLPFPFKKKESQKNNEPKISLSKNISIPLQIVPPSKSKNSDKVEKNSTNRNKTEPKESKKFEKAKDTSKKLKDTKKETPKETNMKTNIFKTANGNNENTQKKDENLLAAKLQKEVQQEIELAGSSSDSNEQSAEKSNDSISVTEPNISDKMDTSASQISISQLQNTSFNSTMTSSSKLDISESQKKSTVSGLSDYDKILANLDRKLDHTQLDMESKKALVIKILELRHSPQMEKKFENCGHSNTYKSVLWGEIANKIDYPMSSVKKLYSNFVRSYQRKMQEIREKGNFNKWTYYEITRAKLPSWADKMDKLEEKFKKQEKITTEPQSEDSSESVPIVEPEPVKKVEFLEMQRADDTDFGSETSSTSSRRPNKRRKKSSTFVKSDQDLKTYEDTENSVLLKLINERDALLRTLLRSNEINDQLVIEISKKEETIKNLLSSTPHRNVIIKTVRSKFR